MKIFRWSNFQTLLVCCTKFEPLPKWIRNDRVTRLGSRESISPVSEKSWFFFTNDDWVHLSSDSLPNVNTQPTVQLFFSRVRNNYQCVVIKQVFGREPQKEKCELNIIVVRMSGLAENVMIYANDKH